MKKMQNFDIENLERKNIYPVTDDFFARMQEHVLNEVKQPPIIEMKPRTKPFPMWWAAAAVLALVFGITFWLNADRQPDFNTASISKQATPETRTTALAAETHTVEMPVKAVTETPETEKSAVQDLTKIENEHPNYSKAVAKSEMKTVSSARMKTSDKTAEVEVADEVIHSLTKDELSDLTSLAENDVYLDLYY